MDKEQAKFILQSFRPDGADAADTDFAEALQLAVENRELGEWLADERATDAAFASALCEVEIPEELRQHILAVMRGEKPTDPEMDAAMDNILFDAMGDVQPSAGLREQILAAMEVENSHEAPSNAITPDATQAGWFAGWAGWKKLAAVAAAVVLGTFVAFQMTSTNPVDDRITSHDVQQHAGKLLNASFELDVKGPNPESINTWLVSHELPSLSGLPESLQNVKKLGCKEIKLPGDKKASLVCFREGDGGTVHVIIVKNDYIEDRNLPTLSEVKKGDCYHCPKTKWNIARWQDGENTFIMLAKKDASAKNELLKYF